MRTIRHSIAGDDVEIHVVETRADLAAFDSFLSRGDAVLAIDTETTGLGIFEHGFAVRLFQIGNGREAFVLDASRFAPAIQRALRQPRRFVAHNATFDLLAIDHRLGVSLEDLGPRVFDTRTLAHLLDPRGPEEGGAGLALKPLSAIYVDDTAPDTQTGLYSVFRSYGLTKETGWAGIPLEDETYLRYAGLDVILAHRLFYQLAPIVKDLGLDGLSAFEHHLALLLAIMQRRGVRLDVPYIDTLETELAAQAAEHRATAARYGVENVSSTAQVSAALVAMGETLTERTKTGLKVDKGVLLPLADLETRTWERLGIREPNPLADAVVRAKRAKTWGETYVGAFRNLRDPDDRLHASINGLQARTARMSISRPPLQQLPSTDWMIRRAVLADEGNLFVSADYDQIELRVLAALADVKAMKRAIEEGIDLHGYTATLVYGEGYTKPQRSLMKGVGFGKVYGGGAPTLSRQTGAPLEAVKGAIAEYDRVYPEIRRYSRRLQDRAQYGKREVVTASGRHLPLDRDRLYAALNYVIQSTARDVLAQAIVDLFDAGLGDYLTLPIHDEILAQAPAAEAEEVAREIGRVMSVDFRGVPLTASGEVTGPSWGHGYGCVVKDGGCTVSTPHPHLFGIRHDPSVPDA